MSDSLSHQEPNKKQFHRQAFARNIGLFTPDEQQELSNKRVAIPGMGGVGGIHLITLVRLGIGKFNIADLDAFEIANINRQYGAKTSSFNRAKTTVMTKEALDINPHLSIRVFPDGINEGNIDSFLEDCDLVIDGLDFFNFDARRLLFNTARKKGLHVITAGPIGFSAAMLIFGPHGMEFDDYFNISSSMTEEEKLLAFAIGLAPKALHMKYMDPRSISIETRQGPSSIIGCQMCAAAAATEALRILLGKKGTKVAPHFFQYDLFVQSFRKGYLLFGNRNPWQRIKLYVVKRWLQRAAAARKIEESRYLLE